MIRKLALIFFAVWFMLGCHAFADETYHAEPSVLEEQVLLLEFSLKNKAYDEIKNIINTFDPELFNISPSRLAPYSDRLLVVGAELYGQGQKEAASILLTKLLALDPSEWRAISFLNQYREDKKLFDLSNIKKIVNQTTRLFRNFEPSVILATQINTALFWAVLLTLLSFSFWMIRNYFSLATHDMIRMENGLVDIKKLAMWAVILLWPIVLGAGWFLFVMIIIASLWFYTEKSERKALIFLFIILAIMTLISSVNQFLIHQLNNQSFLQTKKIIQNDTMSYDEDEIERNQYSKMILALNNFNAGHLEEGMEWLNSADDTVPIVMKKNLYGYAFLSNKDYQNAISTLTEVLARNPSDQTALHNLSAALLENSDQALYDAFVERFPKLKSFQEIAGQPKLPHLSESFILSMFLSAGKKTNEGAFWYIAKSCFKFLLRMPIIYFFIIFFVYVKFLPLLFHSIGRSTHCTKCQKIIKKENTNRAINVCNDCYQLFLIKDTMMADAKSFKETEINRKNRRKNMILLLFSFLSPGFFLHMRGQHRLFAVTNYFFYLFLIIAWASWQPLAIYCGAVPLFAKAFGILAALVFLFTNLLIFQGDEYGI